MPSSEPTTVLLVSDQAEDIKLMTIGLRGFYPGCRVEAVYSAQEATEWASKGDWHVILVDEHLPPQGYHEVLPELRRRAANAAILVLSDRSDAATSSQVLRAGGDGCLLKTSSGFLAELMVVIREILEKRDLRTRMDLTQSRYLRLVEVVPDVVYELDREGRFSFISPNVLVSLGYSPEELLGAHYSSVVHPADRTKAEGVMNERRTGARSTKKTALRLTPKAKTAEEGPATEVEIHAKGLYDRQNQFVGTIGIARDLTTDREASTRFQQLAARAQQAERLLHLRHLTAKIAEELSTPLTLLLEDTAGLLKKVEALRLEDQLQHLLSQVLRAAQLGKHLTASTLAEKFSNLPVSINELIEEALSIKAAELEKQAVSVERQLETALPVIRGDADQLRHLFVIITAKAEEALRESAHRKRLLISTQRAAGEAGLAESVRIQISDGGWAVRMTTPSSAAYEAEDQEWDHAAAIVKQHHGIAEVAPSSLGGLFIQIWLPTSGGDLPVQPPSPGSNAAPRETQRPPEAQTIQPPEPPHPTTPTGEIALAERRQSARSVVQLDARLTHQGKTWTGQVRNIGPTGLSMDIEGLVPATVNQSIQLGLVTAAAVLQVEGKVRGIREVDRRRVGTKFFPATGLSVQFVNLNHDERLVLASLFESLHEGAVSLSLTALLQAAEPGDILVEVRSEAAGGTRHIPLEAFPPESEELRVAEHRFAARANYVTPAALEEHGSSSQIQQYPGSMLNLSRCGACLRLQAPSDLVGQRLNFVLPLATVQKDTPSRGHPQAAELRVGVEVLWAFPDHSRPRELQGTSSPGTYRVGVRFLHIDEDGERQIATLVAKLLTAPLRLEDFQPGSELVSTFMECKNQKGYRVAVYYDRPRKPLPPGSPLVIISPDFGETKREYIALAYALALNGFHVLRYDHTNHVGESQGEMVDTTVTGMKGDLVGLWRFAGHTWPASPIVLIAVGLSARIALRVVAEEVKVNLLVILGCVADLASTLQSVHGQDIVTDYCQGVLKEATTVLGWNVNATAWLSDMVQGGYADVESTIKDAQQVQAPTIVFAAERDPTQSDSSVQQVQAALSSSIRHHYTVPGSFRLHEEPRTDRALYRHVIAACREACYPMAAKEQVHAPSLREIGRQSVLEWERLFARHAGARPERLETWGEELAPLQPMTEPSDYWRFLDDIYRLIGQPQAGELILDASCGNAQFGAALMTNEAYHRLRVRTPDTRAACYVGIDAIASTVARARENLSAVAESLRSSSFSGVVPEALLHTVFSISELHRPLPFRDNSFHRIVSNLPLGSTPDPLSCVRELTRVLRPCGKLVITNFKPYANLTDLFHNLMTTEQEAKHQRQVQQLLALLGQLLERERNGLLRQFDQRTLLWLLTSGGAERPRVYQSLSNQAYIAVAEKPA